MLIRKRYLLILSVALVSVILGSLLYNSIAQAGKPEPTTYKDAVEINILDWTRLYGGSNYPIELGVHFNGPLEFPFVFSPTVGSYQGDLNVTSLSIGIIGSTFPSQEGIISFKVGINDDITLSIANWDITYDIARTVSTHLENHPSLQTVEQGINVLSLYDLDPFPFPAVTIHKITVFIEYEYQA